MQKSFTFLFLLFSLLIYSGSLSDISAQRRDRTEVSSEKMEAMKESINKFFSENKDKLTQKNTLAKGGPLAVNIVNGFSGYYDPLNWSVQHVNSNGFIDLTNVPASITITGTNNAGPGGGYIIYYIFPETSGIISFNWEYNTIDGPMWDPAFFLYDDDYDTQLTDAAGPKNQSGFFSDVVSDSWLIGFAVLSLDNLFGPGVLTISNFQFEGSVTVWPGDANNDGIVNNKDINTIKSKMNKRGPKRTDRSTAWKPILVTDLWNPAINTHADCNGDGVVNGTDFTVVLKNFGKKVPVSPPKENGEDDIASFTVTEYSLMQNYPNPFNPSTTIRFNLPEESLVQIKIYNINGELVETLIDEVREEGSHGVQWSPENLPSGMYIYRMYAHASGNAGVFTEQKKLMFIK